MDGQPVDGGVMPATLARTFQRFISTLFCFDHGEDAPRLWLAVVAFLVGCADAKCSKFELHEDFNITAYLHALWYY